MMHFDEILFSRLALLENHSGSSLCPRAVEKKKEEENTRLWLSQSGGDSIIGGEVNARFRVWPMSLVPGCATVPPSPPGLVTVKLNTVKRAGRPRSLGSEVEGERILVRVLLLTRHGLLILVRLEHVVGNLRELPSNIVLRAQSFSSLLQASKISRRHHTRTIAGRSGH